MKIQPSCHFKARALSVLMCLCYSLSLYAPLGYAQDGASKSVIEFVDADVESIAKYLAERSGKSVIVDPKVKGTITWSARPNASISALWNEFSVLLRQQNIALLQTGMGILVVPEQEARAWDHPILGGVGATSKAERTPSGGQQYLTKVIALKYENAQTILSAIKGHLSNSNNAQVQGTSNSIVVSDYAGVVRKIEQLVESLDKPSESAMRIINIKNLAVQDMAPILEKLIAGNEEAGGNNKTVLIAEPKSNSLIIKTSSEARLEKIVEVVNQLDHRQFLGANGDAGSVYVVTLKNAQAEQLAQVLNAALGGTGGTGNSGSITKNANSILATLGASTKEAASNSASAMGGQDSKPTLSSGSIMQSAGGSGAVRIQADATTNSLIINASEVQYRQIRAVIDQLDVRRAQVFVESLIVEVNADKAAEFGIQWQTPWGQKGDSIIGLLGTNFSTGGKNILQLALGATSETNPTLPAPGFNLGAAKRASNGTYVLGALARFLEEQGVANVLSTPTLLTLDNEEARIIIGQNVPFVTGQFTNTGAASGSVNPFQTIERKDVGLSLKVKPQISENGTVRMQVFQEVSNVAPASINSPTGLITNKRSIESNVLVEDGAVVVLGGLLQDEYVENEQKVPGVSEVPLFGNLFKNQSRDRKKTNLMIFLRPMVVRTGEQTKDYSLERYNQLRTEQQKNAPKSSALVRINEAPLLPSIEKK